MKKIFLVAYREFSIRIRNKTFLISTLLLPIGIFLFYGAIILFMSKDFDNYKIGVIDQNNKVYNQLEKDKNFEFVLLDQKFDLKDVNKIEEQDYSAIVQIPSDHSDLMAGKLKTITYTKIGLMTKESLTSKFQEIIEKYRYTSSAISISTVDSIKKGIEIQYVSAKGDEANEIKEGVSYALGFGFGFLMYMILSIYGAQVMRGVMEEKTNRIVEIIISSVKPFELLMGKILGIAMVSFLQLLCWGVLIFIVNIVFGIYMGTSYTDALSSNPLPAGQAMQMASNPEFISALQGLGSIQYGPLLLGFAFYFIFGFLLYASLFAAVGSAVGDDPQDVQQLMLPIMLPIIFSFVLLTKSINNPNSSEAVIGSMVPFTSPIVMMSRLVYGVGEGVPLWQLLLSMAILVASTVFFIFMASRIYRIGILLYGKKTSWNEMIKWVFKKV